MRLLHDSVSSGAFFNTRFLFSFVAENVLASATSDRALTGPRQRFAMTGAASAALCAAIVALALVLPAQGAPEGRLLPPTPQPRSFHMIFFSIQISLALLQLGVFG